MRLRRRIRARRSSCSRDSRPAPTRSPPRSLSNATCPWSRACRCPPRSISPTSRTPPNERVSSQCSPLAPESTSYPMPRIAGRATSMPGSTSRTTATCSSLFGTARRHADAAVPPRSSRRVSPRCAWTTRRAATWRAYRMRDPFSASRRHGAAGRRCRMTPVRCSNSFRSASPATSISNGTSTRRSPGSTPSIATSRDSRRRTDAGRHSQRCAIARANSRRSCRPRRFAFCTHSTSPHSSRPPPSTRRIKC